MAATQCPGCKAWLSVPGLVHCPLCQNYLNPPHHQAEAAGDAAASAARRRASRMIGAQTWLAKSAVAAIGAGVVFFVVAVAFPSAEKLRHRKVMAALTLCQRTIQSTAQYGDADLPPYTQNYGSNDEFYFAWAPGSFHFSNAFGGRQKMSASCIGSISTGEIAKLTVNGIDLK